MRPWRPGAADTGGKMASGARVTSSQKHRRPGKRRPSEPCASLSPGWTSGDSAPSAHLGRSGRSAPHELVRLTEVQGVALVVLDDELARPPWCRMHLALESDAGTP